MLTFTLEVVCYALQLINMPSEITIKSLFYEYMNEISRANWDNVLDAPGGK